MLSHPALYTEVGVSYPRFRDEVTGAWRLERICPREKGAERGLLEFVICSWPLSILDFVSSETGKHGLGGNAGPESKPSEGAENVLGLGLELGFVP